MMGGQGQGDAGSVAKQIENIDPIEAVAKGKLSPFDGERKDDGERKRRFSARQKRDPQGRSKQENDVEQWPGVRRVMLQSQR